MAKTQCCSVRQKLTFLILVALWFSFSLAYAQSPSLADLSVSTHGAETGPQSIVFTVTLDQNNNTGSAITFDINPTGGTAAAGDDFSDFSGSSISVENGQITGTLSVSVIDDALFENTETVIATISNSSDPSVTINTASATADITDNDNGAGAVGAVLTVTTNGNESGPVNILYTLTLSKTNNTGGAITFDIDPAGGTAAAGSDYTDFAGNTISIADGQDTNTFSVTVLDDSLFENSETLQASVSNPSDPAVTLVTPSATASIADNDNGAGAVTADLSVAVNGDEQGTVAAQFTVTLSKTNNTGSPVTFSINPFGGTATAVDDYADFTSQTISVPSGSSTGTYSVTIIDDALFEDDETVTARIATPSDPAVVVSQDTATADIIDNDNSSVNAVLSVDTQGAESGPVSIVFRVTLAAVNNTHAPINFDLDPSGGTATVVYDYQNFAGTTLVVPDGADTGTVTVPVQNDALFENDETVIAEISNPSNPAINLATPTAAASIVDDDNTAASINAVLSVTPVAEETGPTNFVYTLSIAKTNNTGSPITFSLNPTGGTATAGSDYADFSSTTLSIPHGQSSTTLSVAAVDDALFENDETVIGTVSAPSDPAINIATASGSTTIVDNDNGLASVTAALSAPTIGDEDGPQGLVFRVTLSKTNNTHSPITFTMSRTGGTAAAGIDFTDFDGGTISVPDGSATGDLVVDVADDALFENTETVSGLIYNQSDPAIQVTSPRATGDILDNDNTAGSISADLSVQTNGNEAGPVNIVYLVTLSKQNDTGSNVSFTITADGGTSTPGSDFTDYGSAAISVPSGSSTGTFSVSVTNDSLFENTETAIAAISNASDPAVYVNTASASANIADNDNSGITADLAVVRDGNEDGPVDIIYRVTLSKINNTGSNITFDVDPTAGSATAGVDYTDFSGSTIIVPNGSPYGELTVTVLDDPDSEGDETVEATISSPSDPAVSIGTASATAVIADDENPGGSLIARLSVVTHGSEEGPQSIVYTVYLSAANTTGSTITFDIDPNGGTAAAGSDYTDFAGGTVSIAEGEATGSISVPVTDDSLFENNETATAEISNCSEPSVTIAQPQATATIFDNDNAQGSISVSLSGTQNGNETGPVDIIYTLTSTKTNNTGSPITFNIAPSGGSASSGIDYTDFSGTISIPDGSDTGTLTVTVLDDSRFQNNHTVQATISNPSDAAIDLATSTVSATATIIDNDNPALGINAVFAVTSHGSETGPVNIVYTVTLGETNYTGGSISFTIAKTGGEAIAGSDYITPAGSTISVGNGSSTGTFAISVTDDALFENTETLELSISNASDPAINITTASASGNITDNDNGAGTIAATLAATTPGREAGPVNLVYTVTLSKVNYSVNGAVSYDIDPTGGTATAGSDYTDFSGGTILVPYGSSFGTYTVTISDDSLFENTETVEAAISSPSDPALSAGTSATGSIIDNDNTANSIAATLSVVTNGDETGSVSIVYQVQLAKTNSSPQAITFAIYPSGGTATPGADFTDFTAGTISVPSGSDTGTLTVAVTDDGLFENTETVEAIINSPSDIAIYIADNSATASITDNDNAPGSIDADLSVDTHGDEDGPVSVVYAVTLSTTNNTGQAIDFDIQPTGGSATAGSDYTSFVAGTISVPDGSAAGTLTVNIADDALFENDETVQATISNPSDAAININTASATANIYDNDNGAGSVGASLGVAMQGDETGPVSVVYRVTLVKANNTHAPVTFAIDPSGGTATVVADYADFAGSTITVADGAATGTLSVAVVNDALFENTETVSATISAPSDPAVGITTATAVANISDSDNAAGSINADLSVTTHGAETGPISIVYRVQIAKTNNTGASITMQLSPSGGTAQAGADYTNFSGTVLTIADGTDSTTLTVNVFDDALFENTETVQAALSNVSDPAITLNTPSATANITDSDNGAGSISADLSVNANGSETGPVSFVFAVTLSAVNNTHGPVSFDIAPSSGSAAAGSDYADFTGGTISVPDGSAVGTLSVTVVDDALFENTETVEATISNPADPATFISTASATADIADNDNGAGAVNAVLSATRNGDEDGLIAVEYTLTLAKANNTHGPITFDIDPDGGTADSGSDYAAFVGSTITIPDGASSATFEVAVLQDALFENNETLLATVSNASDAAIGIGTPTATGTIIDNDNGAGAYDAVLSLIAHGNETGPVNIQIQVEINTTNNTHGAITFDLSQTAGSATAGSDYVLPAAISIPDGASSASLTLNVSDDALFENDETATITLASPSDPAVSIATPSVAATITDNDNGAASVTANLDVETNGDEEGPSDTVYRVTLSKVNNTHAPITFNIDPSGGTAIAGTDYANFGGGTTISVLHGSATGTVSIGVIDDDLFENSETAAATISSPSDPAVTIGTASTSANILDNDNSAGTVNAVLTATRSGNETGLVKIEYTLTIAKTNNTGTAIDFDIDPDGGTASAGSDYTDFAGSTVSIADGADQTTFEVTVADDGLFENNESVVATVSNPSDPAIGLGTPSATGTIIDNDNAAGSYDASLSLVSGGNETGPVHIQVQLDLTTTNNTHGPITFDITQSAGTASIGTDYVLPATVSIPDGANSAIISFTVSDDALFENDETLTLVISNSSDPAVDIAGDTISTGIVDNDNGAAAVTASLGMGSAGSETGPTSLVFQVTLSKANNTHSPITFTIDPLAGGTAVVGDDYVDFPGGTVTVPDGSATGDFSVAVLDDDLFENTETVNAEISAPSDPAISITTATAAGNILDSDNAAGSINAVLSATQVGAETGPVSVEYTLTIAKINNTRVPITFSVNPTSGTATAGGDYTDFSGTTLSIAHGASTTSFTVPVLDDELFENSESLIATVSNSSDPAIGFGTPSATGTILDSDNGAGSISANLSLSSNGSETGPAAVVFQVTLSKTNNTHGPVSFRIDPAGGLAVAGSDYTNFAAGTISVPDGSATGTFNVTVIDDALFENGEDVSATISNPVDPATYVDNATAAGTIADNDNGPGAVNGVLSVTTNGNEVGPVNVVYTLTLAKVNNTHGDITIDINPSGGTADLGTDYVDFTGGSLTIPDGAASATFSVTVYNDTLFENDETIMATVANPSDPAVGLGTPTATAILFDSDNGAGSYSAVLSLLSSGDETGPVNIEIRVEINKVNNTHVPITFNLSQTGGLATAGSDYVLPATISVPDGGTTATLTLNVADDAFFENNETATITISNSSDPAVGIGTPSITATIIDNDNGVASVSADLSVNSNGNETGPLPVVYAVTLSKTNYTHFPITFSINPSGGTATAVADYANFAGGTISVPHGASVGTLSVSVVNDLLFENTEDVESTISVPGDPAVYINTASAVGTIADSDNAAGSVNAVLSATRNGNETGTVAIEYTLTIGLTNNTRVPISFDIDPSGGNATAGSDYTDFAGSSISIPDGANSVTFEVPVGDDILFENNETLLATVSNASDPAIGLGTPTATGVIIDDDNAPASYDAVLTLISSGSEVGPASIQVQVEINKTNNTHVPISFNIDQTAGLATANSDYMLPATVEIPDGASSAVYSLNVFDDALFENDEAATLTISGSSDPAVTISAASVAASITDNDNGVGSVAANLDVAANGSETGPASVVYRVTLAKTNNTHSPITVAVDPSGGTAVADADYNDFSGSIIAIADGATTGTLSVPVMDDVLFENTETAQATISAPSDPAVAIGIASAAANIADDDNGAGSINAALSATRNGDENGLVSVEYTVTLGKENNTHGAITFTIDPGGGSAVLGGDYTDFSGGTISVPDGAASGTFTVAVLDDTFFENSETVIAAISAPSDPAINIGGASATGTILDDDNAAGTIGTALSVTTHGNETGPVAIVYTVTLDKANNTHGPITVAIDPSGGSATAGSDYTDFGASSVVVADGATSGSLSVAVVDDAAYENTETAEATISAPSDPALGITTASATANITDNDNAPGTIGASLSVTTHGDETGPAAIVYTVTLTVSNETHAPIIFDIDPTGGTASAGSDYTDFSSSTISVAHGATTGTLSVAVVDDGLFENTETVQATLSNPSDPAVIVTTPLAAASITDNDNGAGSITADLSVTTHGNEAGPVDIVYTVTLSLANNTHAPLTLNISPNGGTATAGADYANFVGATVSIPDGSQTGTYSVVVNNDALFENTETVGAIISNPSDPAIVVNAASADANIIDNDNGAGSVNAVLSVNRNGNEDGPVSIRYMLTLSSVNNTHVPITFGVDPSGGTAVAGSDYVDFSGGTISIPHGSSSALIDVAVIDDALFENNETVLATISAPSDPAVGLGTPTASGAIFDNDNGAGTITAALSVDAHGSETGPASIVYRVTMSVVNHTHQAISFDITPSGGTASPADDYADISGATISVPDGETTGTLTVAVFDDALFENTETAEATISSPSDTAVVIATATASANISDNDNGAATVAASLSASVQGEEAGPVALVYEVTLSKVNETHGPISFTIDPAGGTAALGSDYVDFTAGTISVPHGASSGTMNVTVIDDVLFENTETLDAVISAPTDPAVYIDGADATGDILDDDNTPGSINADLTVTSNGDETGPVSVQYRVTIDTINNTGSPITFTINPTGGGASVGDDYFDFSGSVVSIGDGMQTGTLTVAVFDDAIFENTETLQATISNPSDPAVALNTPTATANIADNDNTPGSISADLSVTADGAEAGAVSMVFSVQLSAVNGTGSAITFDIDPVGGSAVPGADYLDFSGAAISVPHGANSGSLVVPVVDDALFENNETVVAEIANSSDPAVTIGSAAAAADIIDNDNAVGSIAAQIAMTDGNEEGPVNIILTLTIGKANHTGAPITFEIAPAGGSASAGADYVDFSGVVIAIPDGADSGSTSINVLDDVLFENTETVLVSINAISDPAIAASAASYSGTIIDSEAQRDSDGDGILDGNECPGAESSCPDSDGDGLLNHLDADDDGDGIPTALECPTHTSCQDSDGDSVPDYLEHNIQDTDDDGLTDVNDPDDDGDGVPTQSEISNPLVLIDVDGDRIPDYLDADTDGPGAGDSDEDGIPDDEECPQGYLCPDSEGDNMPDYMQPVGEVIRSPVYMVWNSFLKQANIVVIVNKSNEEADIVVRVLDIEGGLLGLQSYSLAPSEEFDLIVNELPGYSEDTYGTVRIDFTPPRSIEGHSAIYRFSDTASSLELQPQASGGNNLNTDFAILLPFASSVKGTTYAFFDTIQPSRSEIDENNGIPHWVQIGNAHESHIKGFTVNKYDRDGVLIESVRTLVPPQGRRDIEGGHAVPGPNQVGLLEIVPDDPESRYIAQVFHYGQNSPIGVMPTDFNFAMGESSRSGSALVQYAVVSTGAGSTNWIAIANTAAEPEAIQTKIIDNDGTVVFDQAIFLGPRAQTHLLANAVLPQGHSGVAIMTPLTGKGIIGNTRSYYFDEQGRISDASILESRHRLGNLVAGIYNTFFEQLNWLRVFNTSTSHVSLAVELFSIEGTQVGTYNLSLEPQHGIDLELSLSTGISLAEDSYGLVRVRPSKASALLSDILRVKQQPGSYVIDMGKPMPLR